MTDTAEAAKPELIEDGVPLDGIVETVHELVDLYGGSITSEEDNPTVFVLPLRRGNATAGGIECVLTWEGAPAGEGSVVLVCNRELDAPKAQRVALLGAGVLGAFFFMFWPFYPNLGPLAWIGGVMALGAYFLSLKKTAGGLASDFLQRVARRQRSLAEGE
jgi:hypothetical protein